MVGQQLPSVPQLNLFVLLLCSSSVLLLVHAGKPQTFVHIFVGPHELSLSPGG